LKALLSAKSECTHTNAGNVLSHTGTSWKESPSTQSL